MKQDNRWFPRFSARDGVVAVLSSDDGQQIRGKLIDVSCSGAYVSRVKESAGKSRVEFEVRNGGQVLGQHVGRECVVHAKRTSEHGGCALRFTVPLTGPELALLAQSPESSGSLELAREDYRIVNAEISHVQTCRSNLFIATLAAVSAWTIAALGIGLTNRLGSPIWVTLGVSFPLFLLAVGILATIEKADAINLRKGFLAALTDYLKSNVAPPNYGGWAHLKLNRAECRSRVKSKLCPAVEKPCWEPEISAGADLTRKYPLIGNPFGSFMAFVSLIYGSLFVLALALLAGVGTFYYGRPGTGPAAAIIALVVGIMITLVAAFLYQQLHSLRRGRKSAEAYYCQWQAVFRHCWSVKGVEPASVGESKRPATDDRAQSTSTGPSEAKAA